MIVKVDRVPYIRKWRYRLFTRCFRVGSRTPMYMVYICSTESWISIDLVLNIEFSPCYWVPPSTFFQWAIVTLRHSITSFQKKCCWEYVKEIKSIFQYYLSPLMLERSIFCSKFMIHDCLGCTKYRRHKLLFQPKQNHLNRCKKFHCHSQVALRYWFPITTPKMNPKMNLKMRRLTLQIISIFSWLSLGTRKGFPIFHVLLCICKG